MPIFENEKKNKKRGGSKWQITATSACPAGCQHFFGQKVKQQGMRCTITANKSCQEESGDFFARRTGEKILLDLDNGTQSKMERGDWTTAVGQTP